MFNTFVRAVLIHFAGTDMNLKVKSFIRLFLFSPKAFNSFSPMRNW